MSGIDIVILVVAIAAILWGMKRGIIRQIGAVAAVVVGVALARAFGPMLVGAFSSGDSAGADYVASVVAHIVVFLVGYIGTRLIARVIRKVSHALMLGPLDRLAGALFCLFTWLLGLSLALNVWQAFRPDRPLVDDSHLAQGQVAQFIMDYGPAIIGGEKPSQLFAKEDC